MKYINIEISVTHTPEFLCAEPTQRATWLSLLSHCCEQENGGKVAKCSKWNDREWQLICGITLAEAQNVCGLWHFKGQNLVVRHYPEDQEKMMKNKRLGGAKGGRKSRKHSLKESLKDSLDNADKDSANERKGKERKGNVINVAEANSQKKCFDLPKLEQVLEKARTVNLSPELATAWFHRNESRPISPDGRWTDHQGQVIFNWQSALTSYAVFRSNFNAERLPGGQNGASKPFVKPTSVWEAKEKIKVLEKELEILNSNPENKQYKPESWDREFIPEIAIKVKAMRVKISELKAKLVA